MERRHLFVNAAALFAVGLIVGMVLYPVLFPYPEPEAIHVKFALDWAIQGPHAPFVLALEKGYFAQEGLAVTMDRGFGSADAVSKAAAGTYPLSTPASM